MASRRAKQILNLINRNKQDVRNSSDQKVDVSYEETCQNKGQAPQAGTSAAAAPCSLPLPPEAEEIFWEQNVMRDIWNDVFSEDLQEESTNDQIKSAAESISKAPGLTTAVTPTQTKSKQQLSAAECQTDADNKNCDAIREDPYMATDKMTPISLIDCPQSVNSLVSDYIDSPKTPFSPIFNITVPPSPASEVILENDQTPSALALHITHKKSSPVTENDVCRLDNNSTPVPPSATSTAESTLKVPGSTAAPTTDPKLQQKSNTSDRPQLVNSRFPDSPKTPLTHTVLPSPETENNLENDQSDTPSTSTLRNDVSRLNNLNTPVPSPINRHTKCDDPFCCQHDSDEYECPSVDTVSAVSNQPSPEPSALIRNKRKKRPLSRENWGDIKRKKLMNQGKTYCSKRGHTVEAKMMGPPCSCRFKCYEKFSNEERSQIFTRFWELGDREKQWLHLANYTKKTNKKRTFQRELLHNREYTYKYYLPKYNDEDGSYEKTDVCKNMFLKTLGISERMKRTAWKKYDGSTSLAKDMRGRHTSHKKKINHEMILSVCAHVNGFVPVESHYCRKFSKRLYLDGSLSIARMYEMYKTWPDLGKYTSNVTTLRQYRDIVNTHFNLSFHIPKKDTCDQCHIFKHIENPSEDLKANYEQHQRNKTLARNLKNSDKTEASESSGTILCATFDFQKVLTCPHGQISILYYKRKLSCYDFTIYDMTTKKGYCYVWDDSVAKRGANEVSSCLYNFIKELAGRGVKEFRFWSDNCAGQNRNRIVYSMYTRAAKEFGVTITHRFLEKGHTQNEGDSVHSVIERAAEHKLIYTPEEWKLLIRWAKIENPYEVIDVTQELVYDFKELLKHKNWTKNTSNEKMTWNKIKEVLVEENQPNKIRYKYKLDDEYKTLVVRKETRNRTQIALKSAYSEPIPISNDKFKDLVDLCKSGIILTKHHDFFNALPHGRAVATDETDDDSE